MQRISSVTTQVVTILLILGPLTSVFAAPASANSGWGPATPIGPNSSGDASQPRVAGNPAGIFVSVWQQFDGNRTSILANRFAPGAGWGTPAILETVDNGDQSAPDVDVDEHGNAIAVWSQGANYVWDSNCSPPCRIALQERIHASRFVAGVGWGVTEVISAADGWNVAPRVAMDPYGNAFAVWLRRLAADYRSIEVWANRFALGGGWGTPTILGKDSIRGLGSLVGVAVGTDPEGNAVAGWSPGNTSTSVYRLGKGWGAPTTIDSDSHEGSFVDVAMDPAGDAIAMWTHIGGPQGISVRAIRYVPGLGWSTSNAFEVEYAIAPQVDVGVDGSAIAVWLKPTGNDSRPSYAVYANRFVPDVGWDSPTLIGQKSDSSPQLSANGLGSAIVAWVADDGTDANVWARQFRPNKGWDDSAPVGDGAPVRASDGYPMVPFSGLAVAEDDKGRAIAVWSEYDGVNWNIWANRFVSLTNPDVAATAGYPDMVAVGLSAALGSSTAFLFVLYLRLRNQISGLARKPPNGNGLLAFLGSKSSRGSEVGSARRRPNRAGTDQSPRRWPPNGAALHLTAKERILLHLFDFAKYADATEVPSELTPAGFADRVGVDRRHVAQSVRPLVREGLVRERTARVKGGTRRRKVYVLTDEGRRSALGIRDRVRPLVVRVRDASGLREATVAELLTESRGSLSILEILREWIEAGVVNRGGGP